MCHLGYYAQTLHVSADRIYAWTTDGLKISDDDGVSFTLIPKASIGAQGKVFDRAGKVYVGGGNIAVSDDDGATFDVFGLDHGFRDSPRHIYFGPDGIYTAEGPYGVGFSPY